VAIQVRFHDAELAARVANSLTENYVEQNLEARWVATQKAADWLSQQLLGVKEIGGIGRATAELCEA